MQKFVAFAKKYGVAVASLVLPLAASAQLQGPPNGVTAPVQSNLNSGSIQTTLCAAINWLFYGLMVLAVIFILIAAFRYLTAAGDPEKVKKASHTVLYAAIAIVVGLIARGFPALVGSVSGFNGATTSLGGGC